MRFGTLLDRALRVTWRQKRLWILGLFVAGYGSGGSGSGSGGAGGDGGAAVGSAAGGGGLPGGGLLFLLVALALVLAGAILVVHVASEAGLIRAVAGSGATRTARLGATFRQGLRRFWPVLGLKALAALVALASVALLAAPALLLLFAGGPVWAVAVVAGVDVLLAVPWLVTVYAVYQWALRVTVLEGRGVRAAAREGWRRLHGRLLDALLMLLAEGLGVLGAGLALLLWMIPAALVFFLFHALGATVAGAVAAGLLVLPVGLAVAGALGTWRSSVWTLGILGDAPPGGP